jgi:hypothetical protein
MYRERKESSGIAVDSDAHQRPCCGLVFCIASLSMCPFVMRRSTFDVRREEAFLEFRFDRVRRKISDRNSHLTHIY